MKPRARAYFQKRGLRVSLGEIADDVFQALDESLECIFPPLRAPARTEKEKREKPEKKEKTKSGVWGPTEKSKETSFVPT
jgi:hypothetical protein